MITQAVLQLKDKKGLSSSLMAGVMEEIMTGQALPQDIEAFLAALAKKGETVDEIVAAAGVMRAHATKIKLKATKVLDTCGTGGDCCGTFNISTASALVASAVGVVVAKHGNRSVSSNCGSADVLVNLGVNIELGPDKVAECINTIGIGFLYAPLLHQAMKYAMPVRKKMGMRTIFNILGPLTNPAGARYQLLGVFDKNLTQALACALKNLGSKHVLVVHGEDGLDELTTTAATQISELKNNKVKTYTVEPEQFGIKKAEPNDLKGADPLANAAIIEDILRAQAGPKRDIVLLNAAGAIYAADKAGSIEEGIAKAKSAIDSGKAFKKLEELREFTNRC